MPTNINKRIILDSKNENNSAIKNKLTVEQREE